MDEEEKSEGVLKRRRERKKDRDGEKRKIKGRKRNIVINRKKRERAWKSKRAEKTSK